jgi:hypothetical protein
MKQGNGAYLGTLIAVKSPLGLFSQIMVVRKTRHSTDTLCRIDKRGFYSRRKLKERIPTASYDGWNLDFQGHDYFDVWLVKLNGPASDGARIQWVDSVKSFSISH